MPVLTIFAADGHAQAAFELRHGASVVASWIGHWPLATNVAGRRLAAGTRDSLLFEVIASGIVYMTGRGYTSDEDRN
jgi:hypothetical protein